MTSLKLGGYDPLDVRLDEAAIGPPRQVGRQPSRVPWATWSASSVPVASLLLAGIVLGPRGISLLPPGALSLLDPAIPVALAALAALAGSNLALRTRDERHALAAAGLESGLAALFVAIPLGLVAAPALPQQTTPLWIVAGVLGACAASSLAVPRATSDASERVLAFDVLVPILAGGVLLGFLHTDRSWAALTFVGEALIITVLLAAAAWLLLARAASDTEQRVFVFAAMLLIGGVADYLLLSALLTGLAAGITWSVAGGEACESLRRDLLYAQHSLLVLVLVVAGAHTDLSLASSAVALVYVFLRTVGKLLGGSLAARLSGARERRLLGLRLLSPGVFGVALALNIVRAVGSDAVVLLNIVVVGTIGCEIVAELGRPRDVVVSDGDGVVRL